MTERAPADVTDMPDAPVALERGRYAAFAQPDGSNGLMIYRATGLCESCASCGCGAQQEPIDLSMAGLLKARSQMGKIMKGFPPQ